MYKYHSNYQVSLVYVFHYHQIWRLNGAAAQKRDHIVVSAHALEHLDLCQVLSHFIRLGIG